MEVSLFNRLACDDVNADLGIVALRLDAENHERDEDRKSVV